MLLDKYQVCSTAVFLPNHIVCGSNWNATNIRKIRVNI
jgi:hypothetical protein